MSIVILTFKDIWAGWKDAPLSNHGTIQQAKAAGESLSAIPFSYIITSPLLRAYSTAQAIHSAQPESTRPVLISSPLLREQHFGIAEGNKWTFTRELGLSDEGHWAKGIFPVLDGRQTKFPKGESLDDLRDRARQTVKDLVVPIIRDVVKEKKENVHVALVSHGLCISEVVAAVVALDYERRSKGLEVPDRQYAGLLNTAWTRVTINLADVSETAVDENGFPALSVKVTDVNCHKHLEGLKRQKGIGSQAHDPGQSDIRKFFGGGVINGEENLEEGRAKSNALDETMIPRS
ncbi:phosphoglycerate mutase-like protein [Thelephora ganbajun]|uniref:Phosphoglycerate mutase-like protein n=1 Tax=Thelephora ganbajun TaxID=370292 RepID=A0ACB6Z7L7_THEGA|nr:phosphoglycerate mutase-like protein [Thelephora ganbajun]